LPAPIQDYAMLGNLQTAALVGRDGSIDWLCLPYFGSASCFAALLHDESAGHWRIGPARGGASTRRRYRGDTLVLETEWDTPEGSIRLIDCMPPRGEAADVVRIVEGLSGSVSVRMNLALRFDYGHVVPWVRRVDGDLGAVAVGPEVAGRPAPAARTATDSTAAAIGYIVREVYAALLADLEVLNPPKRS
jgi:GH15 family glucan-1,4-alpha-glucosidase